MVSNNGMPIFIVMGSTGEYDDYHEWVVCGYRNIESAQKHAKLATEDAKRRFNSRTSDEPIFQRVDSPLDSGMQIDYTGTTYFIEETILFWRQEYE